MPNHIHMRQLCQLESSCNQWPKVEEQATFCGWNADQTKCRLPEGHAWERCNSMVIASLHNVIDKSLHGSIAYAETAKELWSDLKDRYSQSNEIRIHQLKREITLANQGGQSVTVYFTKLKTLWDELGAYFALPNYSYTKEFNLSKHFERERVHQFLMCLHTEKFAL